MSTNLNQWELNSNNILMPHQRSSGFNSILFSLTGFSLLILRFGYSLGRYDQSEILPYALYLHDNSLYAYDFFVKGISSFIPNERIIISWFLSFFSNTLPLTIFILHTVSTAVMLLGLEKLFSRFMQNRIWIWTSIIICVLLSKPGLPGANEMYAPYFMPGNLAIALGIWAFHFFLNQKYKYMSTLLIFSSLLQPLTGLQLTLLFTAVHYVEILKSNKSLKDGFMFPIIVYGVTAFMFILLIKLQYDTYPGTLTNNDYFEIMFRFRHPHHYIPSSFSFSGYLFLLFLSVASLFFFYIKNFHIFLFVVMSLAGCLIYTFGVEFYSSVFLANFQWFKVTIWIKILGCIAMASFMEERIKLNFLSGLKIELISLLLIMTFSWITALWFRDLLPWKCHYDFGQQLKEDPVVKICRQIAGKTPKDAVFIQPFEITELKYYGLRSSYVEFKTIVRQKGMTEIWYNRLREVYGVSIKTTNKGFKIQEEANAHFLSLSEVMLSNLKKKGVTHLLTYSDQPVKKGKLIAENKFYKVIELTGY